MSHRDHCMPARQQMSLRLIMQVVVRDSQMHVKMLEDSQGPFYEVVQWKATFVVMAEDSPGKRKLEQLLLFQENVDHQPQQAHVMFLTV
jgi:hypothetical protein